MSTSTDYVLAVIQIVFTVRLCLVSFAYVRKQLFYLYFCYTGWTRLKELSQNPGQDRLIGQQEGNPYQRQEGSNVV